MLPLHLIFAASFGWLGGKQLDVIAFLREENCVLKAQLQGQRRLTDDERRRLAVIS